MKQLATNGSRTSDPHAGAAQSGDTELPVACGTHQATVNPGLVGLIPFGSVNAVRLIVAEAASVLDGLAKHVQRTAAPGDYQTRLTAMLAQDHARKLLWALEQIQQPEEQPKLRNITKP